MTAQEHAPAQYLKFSQPFRTAPSTPDTREALNRRSETPEPLASAQFEPPWMRTELGIPPSSRRDRLPDPKEPLPSVNLFSLVKDWIGAAPVPDPPPFLDILEHCYLSSPKRQGASADKLHAKAARYHTPCRARRAQETPMLPLLLEVVVFIPWNEVSELEWGSSTTDPGPMSHCIVVT